MSQPVAQQSGAGVSISARYIPTTNDKTTTNNVPACSCSVDRSSLKPQAHLQTGPGHDKDQPVSIQTARRIACDAAIVAMIDSPNGEPLNIGRKTRKVPSAMYRALRRRDHCCQYPGCTHSKRVQAHHIQHWRDEGETRLDILVLLCTKHHHAVHEGGHSVRVVGSDARSSNTETWVLEFADEHGKLIPRTADIGRRGNVYQLRRDNHDNRDLNIDATTNECQWLDESMDYCAAVEALMMADDVEN